MRLCQRCDSAASTLVFSKHEDKMVCPYCATWYGTGMDDPLTRNYTLTKLSQMFNTLEDRMEKLISRTLDDAETIRAERNERRGEHE